VLHSICPSGRIALRRKLTLALLAFTTAILAAAQTAPAPPPVAETPAPGYRIGGDVTAPVLTHSVEAEFSDYARRNRICGAVLIGLIVDANGMPQNVHVFRSLEPSLDRKAIEAIEQYRFKPAKRKDGTPVPVRITVEVDFRLFKGPGANGCSQQFPASAPASAKASDLVNPPVLVSSVQPGYTDDARKKHITGTCTLQVTIDTNGIPQNVHVVQSLDAGLDANAIEAVKQWRYKPATRNGVPVPFDSSIDVNFRLRKWF